MNGIRKVRTELLAYTAFKSRRRMLLEQLAEMDEDIRPRVSRLDGMPKPTGGLPRSAVETMAMQREDEFDRIHREIAWIEKRIAPISHALKLLDNQEREVIRLTFHSLEGSDEHIASTLGLPKSEYSEIKIRAMIMIGYVLELYEARAG